MTTLFLILVCLLAPLLATTANIFRLSGRGIGYVATGFQLISAIAGILLLVRVGETDPQVIWSGVWFSAGKIPIEFGIYVGPETLLMMGFIQVVAFLVFLYAAAYMEKDDGAHRFWSGIGLFTAAMNLFVVSASTIQLFMAWEIIGFASFLLIGHYHTDNTAGKAAGKAFLMNRIGDAMMFAGIMLVAAGAGTFSIQETIEWLSEALRDSSYQRDTAIWGGSLLLCGALSKSAQFPLQVWLPDAMKGPTPVSALMHAATLVAAGIWLLFRFHVMFQVDSIRLAASIIGGLTFIIAGFNALLPWDIKKILAYSTMGQLGLMVAGMASGSGSASLMHLWIHGTFKCGFFLLAGILIHIAHERNKQGDAQDIRNLSLRGKGMLGLQGAFVLLACSMAGLPGFSGIFGKEAVLGDLACWAADNPVYLMVLYSILAGNAFTGAYLIRLAWHLFQSRHPEPDSAPHLPVRMLVPVFALAIVNIWVFAGPIPVGHSWLDPFLSRNDAHPQAWVMFAGIGTVVAGGLISWLTLNRKAGNGASSLQSGIRNAGLDWLWTGPVLDTLRAISGMAAWIDKQCIDTLVAVTGRAFTPSMEPGNRNLAGIVLTNTEKVVDEISAGRKPLVSLSNLFSFIDQRITDAFIHRIAIVTRTSGRGISGLQERPLQRNMILSMIIILAIAAIITYFAGILRHG